MAPSQHALMHAVLMVELQAHLRLSLGSALVGQVLLVSRRDILAVSVSIIAITDMSAIPLCNQDFIVSVIENACQIPSATV